MENSAAKYNFPMQDDFSITLLLNNLLPTFGEILEYLFGRLFTKSWKLWFWAKMAIWMVCLAKFGQNNNLSITGSAIFLALLFPKFIPSFGEKSLEQIPRSIAYMRTNRWTSVILIPYRFNKDERNYLNWLDQLVKFVIRLSIDLELGLAVTIE